VVGLGAHHHAVGLEEVLDRRALLEELGVAHHVHGVARVAPHRRGHARAGAHRHGALDHHHGLAVERPPHALGGREHVRQVGRAVLAGRGADGEEDHRGSGDRGARVGGEREAPRVAVAAHDLFQPGLVDGQHVAAQVGDLGRVRVDAGDVVARLGEARAGDEADVPGSDHSDAHEQEGRRRRGGAST
jgi:hypothetical protein